MRFFFFGTLRDKDILEVVTDRAVDGHPFAAAFLSGYRLLRVRRETFPMLIEAPGADVEGTVVEDLSAADIERIRFYESIEYDPAEHRVTLAAGGSLTCHVFAATGKIEHSGEAWTYEDWARRHKAKELRETRLWMALHGHLEPTEADRLWDEARDAGCPLEELVEAVTGAPQARRSQAGRR